ncbi:MAG: DegV family protein [Erysipelotrichaceae bacterium]|nr:DegV family protein [Erysipelotrichaceae bacterium]
MYQIFTDATADFSPQDIERLPDLKVIPMEILFDGVSYTFGPGGNIDHRAFYEMLKPESDVKTSSIAPDTYYQTFKECLEEGKDLIYICFSSGLSSTCNTARLVLNGLKDKYPERKITLVDSLCASLGQALLVGEAVRKQVNGCDYDELVKWLEENKTKVAHWFTLDEMTYLLKGGRITPAAAAIASTLQIKPVLSLNEEGKLYVAAKTRGRHSAIALLLKKIDSNWNSDKCKSIIIGHGNCPDETKDVKEKILLHHPEAEVYTLNIGPVIGCHTGPGIIGMAFFV